MCKSIETMRRAFAALDDAVRGINVTKRRAIVEKNDGIVNLVGFFAVYNDREANYFKTDEFGGVHTAGFVKYADTMGKRRIAYGFGYDKEQYDSHMVKVLSF